MDGLRSASRDDDAAESDERDIHFHFLVWSWLPIVAKHHAIILSEQCLRSNMHCVPQAVCLGELEPPKISSVRKCPSPGAKKQRRLSAE
jgi:hypothetical protein